MSHMKLGILLFSLILFATAVHAAYDTSLFVDMKLSGPYSNDGDTFTADITITNIGPKTAINVQGNMRPYPWTWPITPSNEIHAFGDLLPGDSFKYSYSITRGEEDKVIWFRAFADNARVAESQNIKVPIHPFVIIGIIGTMLGTTWLMSRKTQ